VHFLYSQTSIDAGGSAHFLIRLFCLRDLPKVYGKSALQAFETKCKFEMYTSINATGCGQNIGVRVYTSTHTTGYGLNLFFLHFFNILAYSNFHWRRRLCPLFENVICMFSTLLQSFILHHQCPSQQQHQHYHHHYTVYANECFRKNYFCLGHHFWLTTFYDFINMYHILIYNITILCLLQKRRYKPDCKSCVRDDLRDYKPFYGTQNSDLQLFGFVFHCIFFDLMTL